MIDRDQVLHVARLARLRLTDEEVERMSSELSAVLDHIENISQLDLDGVEPTTHVVELENVLRAGRAAAELAARDHPRARSRRLGRGLPRAEPGRRMSELLDFTAAQAAEQIRGGHVHPGELFDFYRERAAARCSWALISG